MKLKLGVVGFGEFSKAFLEIFLTHPDIEKVVGAELIEDRRNEILSNYSVSKMYSTYEEMLNEEKDLNCIAIFAQRHQHGPMIIDALKAGKHVMTAVPMGCTEEEIFQIVELVKETGLTFMMLETCYYYPCAIYCREKFKTGDFGDFVYGESQYYHDITEMFKSFASVGDGWKRVAGIPPMYYSTHSMSMLFSAIDDYPVEVSCFGFEDNDKDGIYGKGLNDWDNPFSNQTAILKMSKGGFARINEFRRIGTIKPSSYITGLYGKLGAYEGSGMQHLFVKGILPGQEADVTDVSDLINCTEFVNNKENLTAKDGCISWKYHVGYSPIHDLSRLPKAHRNIEEWSIHPSITTGHNGSHTFLVDDFVRAVISGELPPNNAWDSANYTLPGIIAHKSSMEGGKTLKIPFVGEPPKEWKKLTYEKKAYYEE